MRGKGANADCAGRTTGITPACAGKSKKRHLGGWKKGDHPRVCGEKFTCFAHRSTLPGSPPRVRGKACFLLLHLFRCGITPACAGKRVTPSLFLVLHRDHPRVCGEKAGMGVQHHKRRGSPPRVRGKVDSCHHYRMNNWDHPRVCGEKFAQIHGLDFGTGSPPRVRGKVICGRFAMPCRGITPACAGKSRVLFQFRFLRRDHPRVCGEK